jgi:hypothetical protein
MRLTIFVLLAAMAFGAAAQDGNEEPSERAEFLDRYSETENCIRTQSIRRTQVIDDSTIAFFMRSRGLAYVNVLPRRCPQLARNDRFAYEARGSRLCSTDSITVLVQFAGRLEPGFTCRLGSFHVTDPESVEIMIDAIEQGARPGGVTAEPVELPPEGNAEADASGESE